MCLLACTFLAVTSATFGKFAKSGGGGGGGGGHGGGGWSSGGGKQSLTIHKSREVFNLIFSSKRFILKWLE